MSTINRNFNEYNVDPDPFDDHKKRGETKKEYVDRRKKEITTKRDIKRKMKELALDVDTKIADEPIDEQDCDEFDCSGLVVSKPKPKQKIERASPGSIRVKSRGPNDIRLITDDGSIIDLPVIEATWKIEMDEIPTVTLVLEAEIDANGCEVKIDTGKKTIPIEEFLKGKGVIK